MKKFIIFILCSIFFLSCSNQKLKQQYLDEEIVSAISADNPYILNNFLNSGFPINYKFSDGNTLITLALRQDSIESLKVLLEKGVNINQEIGEIPISGTDRKNPIQTPIFYARSMRALKLLVENGASINAINGAGDPLLTYFIKYRPLDYSEYLVQLGANLNLVDSGGWTPIFWASISGNERLINSMYNKNRDVFIQRDEKLNYPIYYAYDSENIRALIKGNYDMKARNIYKENILGEVYLRLVFNGDEDLANLLIKKGVNPKYTSYGQNVWSEQKEAQSKK